MLLGNRKSDRNKVNRFGWVASYIALAIFVAQLLGMGFHRHDVTEEHSDCVSCVLAAHMPSGTPAVSLDVPPTVAVLIYRVALAPLYVFLGQPSYLIPLSQAPPRRTSL